ncbi:MAG: lysophospholipid acyltransferase family protein [Boseongicola sp.]|nr:lysophospholipid acyltransferase family protein [Boseongicola sp.]
MSDSPKITVKDRIQDLFARSLLGTALLIPYETRVRLVGWIMSTIVAPLAGWRRRIRENLELVVPDLPQSEKDAIVRNVPNNVGRTLIEIYSGEEFLDRVSGAPLEGPGLAAFERAKTGEKPVVFLTAHIGNYDVVRGMLARSGVSLAALYKPMTNPAFNEHYVKAISKISVPVFPTDSRGVPALVKHLKLGGAIGIVADVSGRKAPILSFFGQEAHTATSAAEWAIKYDADVIPLYGLRQDDGLSFKIHIDEPIPHGDPETMMQAYNDSVERITRSHMDQWFWVHRRWKLVDWSLLNSV